MSGDLKQKLCEALRSSRGQGELGNRAAAASERLPLPRAGADDRIALFGIGPIDWKTTPKPLTLCKKAILTV
jgi:hypothetical protein